MHCTASKPMVALPQTWVSLNGSKQASLVLELLLLSWTLHAVVGPGRKWEFSPVHQSQRALPAHAWSLLRLGSGDPSNPVLSGRDQKQQSFLQTPKRFWLEFKWLYWWHYFSVPLELPGIWAQVKVDREGWDPKVDTLQTSWYMLSLSHRQTEGSIAVIRREQDGQTKLQAGIWADDPKTWVGIALTKTCWTSFCQGFLQVVQSIRP